MASGIAKSGEEWSGYLRSRVDQAHILLPVIRDIIRYLQEPICHEPLNNV